jgi:site-specific DNA-methyltransferase (adenine-specific)
MAVSQAGFALRGRNPDVLTCIANLSNDEVFTPPEFARRMLDTLTEAWAADFEGANLWANKTVTFLDPCTKSGVFLREVTKRLTAGLADEIPNLEKRVDHILTKQVFGIGTTYLTSLLARRSVYCSKHALGEHSIATGFSNDQGNIWFQRVEHTWAGTNCAYCAAPRTTFDRAGGLDTHAYAFIHTDSIEARVNELFGGKMQFDVIIGNPPYQMTGGAGGSSDSSIYQLFVQQGKRLEPRFLSMVIPSRWVAGGRGLDGFRREMLGDGRLRRFVDYTKMSVAFPGVDFEGGVGYFLWDRDHAGSCLYTLHIGDQELDPVERDLDTYDVFVRDSRSAAILDRVLAKGEPVMSDLVSGDTPFGLPTNFSGFSTESFHGALELHASVKQKRVIGWMPDTVTKNRSLIAAWKLFMPKAYGERGAVPAYVLGPAIVAGPNAVCTQTYVVAGPFGSEREARNCRSYLKTRFARLLVSLRKITQDLPRASYSWVPQQDWTRDWTDEMLYAKYDVSASDIAFIESMIRPMPEGDE